MTDHSHPLDDPSDADLAALAALLARAEPWDELPRTLEDTVVAAIGVEAGSAISISAPGPASLTEKRAGRNRSAMRVLAAAAAIVAIVAGITVMSRGDSGGVTFALEGTDAQPGAWAEATVSATPAGLKIVLDADGLPGAPDGYMYEAWIGDGVIGVSAGTFHLRGGHGAIELWAGVTGSTFDRLWITLEPIDDDAASSSDARLRGEFSLPDD